MVKIKKDSPFPTQFALVLMIDMTHKKSTPIQIHTQGSDTNNDVVEASSNIPQEIMAYLIYHILSHVLSLEYIAEGWY